MGLKRVQSDENIEVDVKRLKKQNDDVVEKEQLVCCSGKQPHTICYDSPSSSSTISKRTLEIDYWPRSEECKELKWRHLEKLDDLEPNMFPYDTPAGIEHWTLWSRDDLTENQVENFVEDWILNERPDVVEWNYDDNADRSIDIYHIHVYFKTCRS